MLAKKILGIKSSRDDETLLQPSLELVGILLNFEQ